MNYDEYIQRCFNTTKEYISNYYDMFLEEPDIFIDLCIQKTTLECFYPKKKQINYFLIK
jgi:hypothetical protein